MRDTNDSPARPNGPLSVALRLGCALLACAGIAVARTPVGADDAAARLRAPEQAVGPALEAAPERDSSLASPEGASVRPARRDRFDLGRSVPAATGPDAGYPKLSTASSVSSGVSRAASGRGAVSASPRGPPASA